MMRNELTKEYTAMIETLCVMFHGLEDVVSESGFPSDVVRPFFEAAQEKREAEAEDDAEEPENAAPLAGVKCIGCKRRFTAADLDAAALCVTCRKRFR